MSEISANTKGKNFERRVANLFTLLGYSVQKDVLVGGRQVDLVIEDRSGPLSRIYIVECKDQAAPVTTSQYDSFRGRLVVAKTDLTPKVRGIIVSSVGFVKEIKAQSQRDEIELVTISELETSVIDFRIYIRDLIQRLENDASLEYFVEPNLRREYLTLSRPAHGLIQEWLADPLSNQMTILGDYGTGKTTLLKHLALSMAQRYQQEALEGGARARVPIFIDLRDYTHAISLKQIVLDLLDTYSIRAASYAAFEHVSRDGQLLLILDGFDEMASRGNYKVTLRNFREMNKSAIGRAKIILSCRTHYFTTHRDVQKFHGQVYTDTFMPQSFTDLYREIATRPNFLITHLMEFEPNHVERYLRHRCGERWSSVQSFIELTYNLTELSRRPVLLNMIVSSEDRITSQKRAVTPGILYQVYTDIWLSENDWSTIIDVSTKADLLEHFAHIASLNPDSQLHYKAIPELIKSWKPDIAELDAIEIDRELRTASFLVRDQEGDYRFSHKSFQEFFYARFLLSAASRGESESWASGFFHTEIYRFIRDLLPSRPDAIKSLTAWVNDTGLPARMRTNAIKCIGGIKDPVVRATLLHALKTSFDDMVRRCAATSLSYYPDEEVVEALIACATIDADPNVRANCLLALGRLNNSTGVAFLISVMEGTHPMVNAESFNTWSLYRAAREFQDDRVAEAVIRQAPIATKIPEACLDLCKHRWSKAAEDYCLRFLEATNNLKRATLAFSLLPNDKKRFFLPKILELIDQNTDNPLLVEFSINSLFGLSDPQVEKHLCRLVTESVETDRRYSNSIAIAAVKVLAADYPEAVRANGRSWMSRGRTHNLRIEVAKEYVKQSPPDGLQMLLDFLTPKERAVTRITILTLIHEHYPESFPQAVLELWDKEPTTLVKKRALEYLGQIDEDAALSLMLVRGLTDLHPGTRVAVCAILSANHSEAASIALLNALRQDNSKWVRLQALRSLCTPGRGVERPDIFKASEAELDADIISLRKELLGL
jgi:HEAT repeat protein